MWNDRLFRREHVGTGAETESEVAARFYRRLAENSLGLMCCHDLDGVLLWINRAAAESLGYAPDEGIGRSIQEFLIPEARPLFPFYLRRILKTGTDSGLMRLQARDGGERIWMYRNTVSDDPDLISHVIGHAVDITTQFKAQKTLSEAFQQTPVGQIEIEADGELRRINRAASEILGVSEFEVLAGVGSACLNEFCREMAATGASPRLAIFTRSDGRVLHLEVHICRVDASRDDRGGVMCVLTDVTDRVRAETKIRNLNAQLEAKVAASTAELRQSNAELREFAHITSHDLQAPLNQVAKTLETLASKLKRSEEEQLIEHALSRVHRMSMLVESLLGYAMAAHRKDSLASRVKLVIAVEESLMNLASAISSSGATIVYRDLPELMVNESDFVQLFQNLISNALKYRSKETPRVEISAIREDGFWMISVKDNGIGIDAAYAHQIFEAFRRLHGSEYAGTGMGLAICKKIVERGGGRIWVESQPSKGSTFRFTIPE